MKNLKKIIVISVLALMAVAFMPELSQDCRVSAADQPAASCFIVKGTAAKSSVSYSWTAVPGAAKYKLYQVKCGKKKFKLVKTTAGLSYTKRGLKRKSTYKAYVVACNSAGQAISRTPLIHHMTKGGGYSNATAVSATTTASVAAGKTINVGASISAKDSKRTLLWKRHESAALRYYSADSSIATVDANGNVTGKNVGAVRIYSVAISGVCAETTVVVGKATPEVTAPSAKQVVYSGEEQELVNAGATSGGTLQYALGDEQGPVEKYSTEIPKATDAGTYYVWYRVVGDGNNFDVEARKVEATIEKATPQPPEDIQYDNEKPYLKNNSLTNGWCWKTEDLDEVVYVGCCFTAVYPESENYISSEHEVHFISCCFAAGTKINMADGSTKKIEDIVVGDKVLTYNHELGKYENQKINYVFNGETKVNPITLCFDDGTEVSITNTHYLFERERLKYVPISKKNVEKLIGNHYFSAYADEYVELVDVVYEDKKVDFYTLYTDYNINYFAEGMLNVSDDVVSYLNFYKFNEDLSVDMDALQADIDKYGLYDYNPNSLITKDEYVKWNGKYANIIIGKGLTTWEEVRERAEEYHNN